MGRVAHTRAATDAGPLDEDAGDSEAAFDTTSPVEPLAPVSPPAPADAGRD